MAASSPRETENLSPQFPAPQAPAPQALTNHVLSNPDWLGLAAIAILAYIATDIAHEVVGHGLGLFLAGGRSGILTTTRLIFPHQLPDPNWRIFDLGGPAGNLLWAALCFSALKWLPNAPTRLRLFCYLSMLLSLFWESGYLLLTAIKAHGDWFALVDGLHPEWPYRILFCIANLLAFSATVRLGIACFNFQTLHTPFVFLFRLCAAATFIATLGPLFDPRGSLEMLNSGLLTTVPAWIGFWLISRRISSRVGPTRHPQPLTATAPQNYLLLISTLAAALFFVFILGPGIKI